PRDDEPADRRRAGDHRGDGGEPRQAHPGPAHARFAGADRGVGRPAGAAPERVPLGAWSSPQTSVLGSPDEGSPTPRRCAAQISTSSTSSPVRRGGEQAERGEAPHTPHVGKARKILALPSPAHGGGAGGRGSSPVTSATTL